MHILLFSALSKLTEQHLGGVTVIFEHKKAQEILWHLTSQTFDQLLHTGQCHVLMSVYLCHRLTSEEHN